MKIALIGVIEYPVEKNATGGTEIWTYNYAQALEKKGDEVTMFSCKESECPGDLEYVCSQKDVYSKDVRSMRNKNILFSNYTMIDLVTKQDQFDVIHLSVSNLYFCLGFVKLIKKPFIVTVHISPLSREDMEPVLKTFTEPYFVFISKSFAASWPKPEKSEVIYHGLNLDEFKVGQGKGEYSFWIGRMKEEKGTAEAIMASKSAGYDLNIGGSVRDEEYYNKKVKPYLSDKIKFLGELGFDEKIKRYGDARVFLAPINWEEPFGLTIIEAMACGTPVIAFGRGAVPELIVDGKTGFVVKPGDVKGMADAIDRIFKMPEEQYLQMRQNCRKHVEENFKDDKMIKEYENLYKKAINEGK